MSTLRVLWAVFVKDVQAELRAREAVVSMLVFALLSVVVFNIAFAPTQAEGIRFGPGVLWIALAFGGVLGLNRSFALEREAGAMTALVAAPVDRGAIYLGKWLANALFIVVLEAIVLPVFAVLYNVPVLERLGRLGPVWLGGALAFSAAGTAFAAISATTRMREVMTPLLLFPAAVPVIIAAVEGTGIVLQGATVGYASAVRLLGGFTVVFATASYILFEFVIEE